MMIWNANLMYYPWGDSMYRPYWRCGIGGMDIDFPTDRGMEATPIVVDGRLYVTSTWSMVYAFDAKTGALLWQQSDQFAARLWNAKKGIQELQRNLAQAQQRDAALVLAQRDEPARLDAFAGRIDALSARVDTMVPRVAALTQEQQAAIQELAVASSGVMPPSTQSCAEMRALMGRCAGHTARTAAKTSSG